MATMRLKAALALAGAMLLLAACTVTPDPDPVVIEKPVDAFNAVGRPYTPHDGLRHGSLSTDVQRLQDARRLYELSRERRARTLERRQRQCRRQSDSRRVPIEGAPGEFVYCQPAVNTVPADID